MVRQIVRIAFLFFFGWQAVAANGTHTSACETALENAMAKLDTEDGVMFFLDDDEEEVVPLTETDELEFLSDLLMPAGLKENEPQFRAARQRYLEELKPLLERFQGWLETMSPNLSFYEKLYRMGLQYDESKSKNEKQAILISMLRKFAVRHENDFLRLIAEGKISMELKTNLSQSLEKIMETDKSWLAPLRDSMKRGGVGSK